MTQRIIEANALPVPAQPATVTPAVERWAVGVLNDLTEASLSRRLSPEEVRLLKAARRIVLDATPASSIFFGGLEPAAQEAGKPHPWALVAVLGGLGLVFFTAEADSSAVLWGLRAAAMVAVVWGVLNLGRDWADV